MWIISLLLGVATQSAGLGGQIEFTACGATSIPRLLMSWLRLTRLDHAASLSALEISAIVAFSASLTATPPM
ncbi:MAG: hypothetical protein ABWZ64_12910, partial [Xanthobacteraceae bacterium]